MKLVKLPIKLVNLPPEKKVSFFACGYPMIEWFSIAVLFWWSVILITRRDTFHGRALYRALDTYAEEWVWAIGFAVLTIGMFITSLHHYRRTPLGITFRLWNIVIWAFIGASGLVNDTSNTGGGVYLALSAFLIIDLLRDS